MLFQVEAGAIETLKEFAGAQSQELTSESGPKVRVPVVRRQLAAVVDDVLASGLTKSLSVSLSKIFRRPY